METIKTYGMHGLSYAMSLLAVVAGLDPTLLAAVGGPKAIAIAGLAGAILTAAHNVQAAGTVKPGTVTTIAKSFALALLIGVVCTVSLVACKTAPSANEQSAVTIATYVVAGRAIKQDDTVPAVWSARAARFKDTAVKLQSLNDSGTATIATLAADLSPLLDNLNPSDRLAAEAVIAALTPYLQEQADTNPSVGYSRERLSVILAAFVRACEAYINVPHAPPH